MTLTDEEFRQLFEVEQVCFRGSWTRETLATEVNNPLSVFVKAQRDGKIVGFALGRVVVDEGELYQIGVLPEFRRQGIAEELLEELHRQMRERGAVCCFLEVRSRNYGAIALYEKSGYSQISVRRGYYDDDDALIFQKKFAETS